MQSAKPNTKGHTLYDSIYVILGERKPYTQRLPATRGGGEMICSGGTKNLLKMMEMFCILSVLFHRYAHLLKLIKLYMLNGCNLS